MPTPGVRDPRRNQGHILKGSTSNPKQPSPTKDHPMELKNGASNPKKISGAPSVHPDHPMELKNGASNPKKNSGAPSVHPDHPMELKNGASNPKKYSGVPSVHPSASSNRLPLAKYPKTPLLSLLRKNQVTASDVNRLLVTINVLGSAGPLRFLARADEAVHKIIETALKSYAREGRLPVLGYNTKEFELYCANSGKEAVEPSQLVGVLGTRNFLLCKKHHSKFEEQERVRSNPPAQQQQHLLKGNIWKSWLNTMNLSFGISFHSINLCTK